MSKVNGMPVFDEQRQAVWIALSDLFLDTDVTLFYASVAKTCAESPFTLDELYRILMHEVAPVCYPNLLAVVGEWAGFDDVWLVKEIASYEGKNQKKHLFFCKRYLDQHWDHLSKHITKLR